MQGAIMEWEAITTWRTVILVDGTFAKGDLMRRKVNGIWQYRRMTPEEWEEDTERQIW